MNFAYLFTPSAAMVLALFGYTVFAGFINTFLPDGSIGSIIIRVVTLIIIFIALRRFKSQRNSIFVFQVALLPFVLFILIYVLRLIDSFYFMGFDMVSSTPEQVFLLLLVGGFFPALSLANMQDNFRSDYFMTMMTIMSLLFLISMMLNLDELLSNHTSQQSRVMLGKLNSISMANISFSFIIYYVLIFQKSRRYLLEAAVIVPILLLIVLYSGSRGAFLAGIVSIVIYISLLKGTKRIWMSLSIMTAILILVSIFGVEHLDGMLKRFDGMIGDGVNYGSSTRKHIQAWSGAYEQFLDNPLIGRYIIELSTNFYPHNIYLESLMSVGLLGSLPFFFHIILSTRAAIGIIRTPEFNIVSVFVAVLFFREFIASASSGAIYGATAYWICSTLVIAFWYGSSQSKSIVLQRD